MISRGIPQQPLVRHSLKVVPLLFLLTLIYVWSCQVGMKLFVFKLPGTSYSFRLIFFSVLGYGPPVHHLERQWVGDVPTLRLMRAH